MANGVLRHFMYLLLMGSSVKFIGGWGFGPTSKSKLLLRAACVILSFWTSIRVPASQRAVPVPLGLVLAWIIFLVKPHRVHCSGPDDQAKTLLTAT